MSAAVGEGVVPSILPRTFLESQMLELWYAALREDIGVVIETDDPDRCIQKLYAARRQAQDPDLNAISIVRSPTDNFHLWLVKRYEQTQSGLPAPESNP